MRKEYASPVTITAGTIQVQTLCASGGGVTPPSSHDTNPGAGGDPEYAI